MAEKKKSIQEAVAEARKAGFSDDEIWNYLADAPQMKEALAAASEDEVKQYIGLTGAQMEGPGRLPAMAGTGIVEGLGGLVSLPGNIYDWLNSMIPEGQRKEPTPEEAFWNKLPDSSQVNEFTDSLGITGRTDLVPRNKGEEYLKSVSTGIGASLPFVPFGAAENLIAGGLSGAGAQAGNDLLPGDAGTVLGALLGGLMGQSATRGIEKTLAKSAATKALTSAEEAVLKYKTEIPGLRDAAKLELADAVMASRAQLEADKAAAQLAHDTSVSGARTTFETEAGKLGPQATWQQAGEVLQGEAQSWLDDVLPARLETVWEPVDKLIPPDAPVRLDNFEAALNVINKSAGAAEPLAQLLKPATPKVIKAQLEALLKGQSQLGLPGFEWAGVRQLRTTLGDAMRDPKIMLSVGDLNMKKLYAALSEDLRTTAGDVGALSEFEAANQASSALFGTAEGTIKKILEASGNPEAVAKAFAGGGKIGATDLAVLRTETPKAADALSATLLRQGLWDDLSPEARASLVPDAAARASLDGAATTMTSAKESLGVAKKTAAEAARVAKANADYRFNQFNQEARRAKAEADANLIAARAKAKEFEAVPEDFKSLASAVGGGTVGGLLLDALNLGPDALMNSKVGAAFGFGAPIALNAGKQLVKDPSRLLGPVIGLGTGNAMMP